MLFCWLLLFFALWRAHLIARFCPFNCGWLLIRCSNVRYWWTYGDLTFLAKQLVWVFWDLLSSIYANYDLTYIYLELILTHFIQFLIERLALLMSYIQVYKRKYNKCKNRAHRQPPSTKSHHSSFPSHRWLTSATRISATLLGLSLILRQFIQKCFTTMLSFIRMAIYCLSINSSTQLCCNSEGQILKN